MLASSIQELVSIKIKPRHDSITDQYNRIFMVKICLICAAIIGVNYFNDEVSCIVANENGMDGGFVGSACWIQGITSFLLFSKIEIPLLITVRFRLVCVIEPRADLDIYVAVC